MVTLSPPQPEIWVAETQLVTRDVKKAGVGRVCRHEYVQINLITGPGGLRDQPHN